jgi:hypothetical protein
MQKIREYLGPSISPSTTASTPRRRLRDAPSGWGHLSSRRRATRRWKASRLWLVTGTVIRAWLWPFRSAGKCLVAPKLVRAVHAPPLIVD